MYCISFELRPERNSRVFGGRPRSSNDVLAINIDDNMRVKGMYLEAFPKLF